MSDVQAPRPSARRRQPGRRAAGDSDGHQVSQGWLRPGGKTAADPEASRDRMLTTSILHRATTRPLALILSLTACVTLLQPRPARAGDSLEERADVAWSVARRQAERTIAVTPSTATP